MRWVTRKPPKMFTEAMTSARKPKTLASALPVGDQRHADRQQRAHHDHRRDGVGDRHQRRVQRRRHAPHHVVADEDRDHEHHELVDERAHVAAAGGEGWEWAEARAQRRRSAIAAPRRAARTPLPLVGRGLGVGGQLRASPLRLPPTPNPSPQGGGEPSARARGVVRSVASSHAPFGCRLGWTILPSLATSVPLTISSSQLTFKTFSFLSIMVSRKASRFLA